MDWFHIIHAAASLIFVIGLIFFCLWLYKYLESKGAKNQIFARLNNHKIEIVEIRRLDAKNAVALIHCENKRHTVLLSPFGNIVLDTASAESDKHE